MISVQIQIEIDESTGANAIAINNLEREDANKTERNLAQAFEAACMDVLHQLAALLRAQGIDMVIRNIPGPERASLRTVPPEAQP